VSRTSQVLLVQVYCFDDGFGFVITLQALAVGTVACVDPFATELWIPVDCSEARNASLFASSGVCFEELDSLCKKAVDDGRYPITNTMSTVKCLEPNFRMLLRFRDSERPMFSRVFSLGMCAFIMLVGYTNSIKRVLDLWFYHVWQRQRDNAYNPEYGCLSFFKYQLWMPVLQFIVAVSR